MTDSVLLSCENQVATITFNRTDKMNAFNRKMALRLEEIVSIVKDDSTIRAVLLKGAGEVFMAGNDLHEFYSNLNGFTAEMMTHIRHFNASIYALREMEKPVLACVHGLVIGTGISLMLASDLVIASDTTQFSMGYSRLAASPAGGISFSLPRIIGTKKAMELLLFSDDIDAHTAEQLGLINWVVPADVLQVKTQQVIDRLVNGPTLAYVRTKQLINSSLQNKISTQLELEADAFVRSAHTRDFKAAVQAFVNKRQPEFEGR